MNDVNYALRGLFRELTGDEKESAIKVWKREKKKYEGDDYYYDDFPISKGKGYRRACPKCGAKMQYTYIGGFRKGKRKPFVKVNSARLFRCTKCRTFFSASLYEMADCGYKCR